MLLRLAVSAGVICSLAAASDQPLRLLNTTPRTMEACTQLALQNAVNPARQKKLMRQNVMAGGINYAYVLEYDQPSPGMKTMASTKAQTPAGCVIPLTREHPSPGTRFELHTVPSPKFSVDSMSQSGMPVCNWSASAK